MEERGKMVDLNLSKGQVSVFVIISIVVIGVIVVFFAIRGNIFVSDVPAEFLPVYNLYSQCIKEETESALGVLGTQGGRINPGELEPGSDFSPFSSQLNFLGIPIPYWYYLSGNNIAKVNVPSRSDMERDVAEFLEERAKNCNFEGFYENGFFINFEGEPEAEVRIEDSKVIVDLSMPVSVSREGRAVMKEVHSVEVQSKMGKFHAIAQEIYDKQISDAFLEEYGVDVLRLYAPVDGVEVQCSPVVWQASEISDELKNGLRSNIASIKLQGNYYGLDSPEDEYFVQDIEVDEQVNFLYVEDWPSKIEMTPAEGELLIAEPIGNQEGLGALGFCYVPYHFVYDVSFPVLIQIHDGLEIFQFPVSVVIDNNVPREAELISVEDDRGFNLCDVQEGRVEIFSFDRNLNAVEAEISFECFDQVCNLGRTEIGDQGKAVLETSIPQCANGFLVAEADGFVRKSQLFSSNRETVSDIILDREYEVGVELFVGGVPMNEGSTALVSFSKNFKSGEDGRISSAVLPENDRIRLSEGSYNVSVLAYETSNIVIPSSTRTQCFSVSSLGLFGFFGGTKEECQTITIPETNVGNALSGGGRETVFILEQDLQEGKIVLNVGAFERPGSLEQLQYNYQAFDQGGIDFSLG